MVSSSLWQNCEENLVGGVRVRLVHIKKSHNFAVKKGRVAHILVPFMVGAICGLPLELETPILTQIRKRTLTKYTLTTHFQKCFFLLGKIDRKLAPSSFLHFGKPEKTKELHTVVL